MPIYAPVPRCYTCEDGDAFSQTNDPHGLNRQYHLDNAKVHRTCTKCDIIYPTIKALKQHWADARCHAYCIDCNTHFKRKGDLRNHLMSPVHEDEYCGVCWKMCRGEQTLDEHRETPEHKSVAQHIPCPAEGCDQVFSTYGKVISHFEDGNCDNSLYNPKWVVRRMLKMKKPRRLTLYYYDHEENTYICADYYKRCREALLSLGEILEHMYKCLPRKRYFDEVRYVFGKCLEFKEF